MNLNSLNNDTIIKVPTPYKQKNSWLEWFRLRRRKPNSEEEINEIHDLISNVYESMDDQARALLLSLSKIVQDEDESVTIEEKIKAIIAIGHSLCCAHIQVKHATQLYSTPLIRTLSHEDYRMRLAAIIAIGETAIDNLSFQMKLNEMGAISKLFETIKTSMPYAGRTLDDINEHSKLIAWSCYTIVNICANCLPNILLLRNIIPTELEVLNDAVRLEIWCYTWRENYAQTILQFVDNELTSDSLCNAIQPKLDLFNSLDDHSEQLSNAISAVRNSNASHHIRLSSNYERCSIL